MSHGRTHWWAKDAAWWRREWIVELGEEFGPEGPAVIDWLSCEAKAQNDGGFVKAGRRTVARGCFVTPEIVSHVLSRSVTLGLLENYEETEGRFTCRISGWKADQEKAGAASRKADQRARESVGTGDRASDVTVGHAESRSVTKSHPTGQDRTGQNNNSNGNVEPRLDDPAIVSELFAYWQQQCGHTHAKLTADRRGKIQARLREGYKPEQVRTAIDGAARAAFVDSNGKRFDDIELVCRTGSKLEDFIARAEGNATSRLATGVSEKEERSARRMAALNRVSGGQA